MPDEDILNIFNQLMLAGLDTVKSALSYSLLYLATHDADRRRIGHEPSIIPTAIEEFLRAFPLVLEGRKLSQDIDFHGVKCTAARWSCWHCRQSCTTRTSSSGPTRC